MNYDPIKLILLIVWLYWGLKALSALEEQGLGESRYDNLLKVAALFGGPMVHGLCYLKKSLKEPVEALTKSGAGILGKRRSSVRKNKKIPGVSDDFELCNSRGERVGDFGEGESSDASRMMLKLIAEALEKRASDIFLDPKGEAKMVVRFRVDGGLRVVMEMDSDLGGNVVSAIKVVAGMDITEKRRPQDGAFSVRASGKSASFRVASVGAFGGEKIALRVLSSGSGPETLEAAGVSGKTLERLKSAIRLPSGMILICGPTGSGKTSTLYAMLRAIDYSLKNVISIEDPIEHVMENISQMEVNNRADITFAKLLRNALRQNPDIICLGEIRDEETAEVSVHAAQTGHLIIATVHSNDNCGTIDRLVNLGVPLRSVASTLQLIVSQRLVRRLCPNCKTHMDLPAQYVEYFRQAKLNAAGVCRPCGCPKCDNTGYSGRVALFDLLVMNSKLRMALEAEGASLSSIKDQIEAEHGSSMMAYEGFKLVEAGVTSIAEIERVTLNLE